MTVASTPTNAAAAVVMARAQQQAQEAMTKGAAQMVASQPFYAHLLIGQLKRVEAMWLPTLATDGRHLFYNPQYVLTLQTSELVGAICHEVCHCAFQHHLRRGNRDPRLWNEAGDHIINHRIVKSGLRLPKGCLMDPRFGADDMTTERAYDILWDEQQENGGRGPCGGQHGDPGGGDAEGTCNCPSSHCSGVFDLPGKDGGRASSGEQAENANDWTRAVVQAAEAALSAGKLPAWAKRLVDEAKSDVVDWAAEMQRFLSRIRHDDYAWLPPNRRHVHNGLYLPSLRNESIGTVVFAIDESGSVGDHQRAVCGGELRSFLGSGVSWSELVVLHWDGDIGAVDRWTSDDAGTIDLTTRHCGGGTTPECVFAWVAEHMEDDPPACVVVLTDMEFYGTGLKEHSPEYPVLWLNIGRETGGCVPEFGEVLYVPVK